MSGFFGVTALGPIRPVGANLISTLGNYGITSFSNEEFQKTFVDMQSEDGEVARASLLELVARTYGFEPLAEEVKLFNEKFGFTAEECANNEAAAWIDWPTFSAGIDEMRKYVRTLSAKGNEYEAYCDMTDDRIKHARKRYGPMDIYKAPMTTAQAIGWHEEEVTNERYPKKSCAETRFADAAKKAGLM